MRFIAPVHGRLARPATPAWNGAKTIMQSQLMWLVFLYVLPYLVYRLEAARRLARFRFGSRVSRRCGAAIFITGGFAAYVSAFFMVTRGEGTPFPADATRRLVIAGPYRYVRNPMAMSSFAQGVGVGVFLGSPLVLLYALAGAIGWNYLVRPWEESDLLWRFGEPYACYRDNVRCWVPRLEPYDYTPGADL